MAEDDVWIETETKREAVDGLEMTAEQLARAAVDPYRWKWIIVGLQRLNRLDGARSRAQRPAGCDDRRLRKSMVGGAPVPCAGEPLLARPWGSERVSSRVNNR